MPGPGAVPPGAAPVTLFLASLGFGLVTASVLAIAVVGFTLQVGVTDVLNLAYGALTIFGASAPFQRRGASPITMVIVSLGMTLIIEFGVQAVAGGVAVSYRMGQGPTFQAGGLTLTGLQLGIIATSVVVMAAVHVLLRYTKLGKAMRATTANRT